MKVLLTRPLADSKALATKLDAAGHSVVLAPVMEMSNVSQPMNCDGLAAIALTSRNAVPALSTALAEAAAPRTVPVYAVGEATAEAVKQAGFADVRAADGDVHSLAEYIRAELQPSDGRIVHLSGRHRAGDLAGALKAAGFNAETMVAYEAVAMDNLPDEAKRALMADKVDAALFYSPRSAATFVSLVRAYKESDRLISSLKAVVAIAISKNTADQLESDLWSAVMVAPDKTSAGMMATLEILREG